MTEITEFKGKYRFLSNFHHAPLSVLGIEYLSSEAAYQACKTLDLGQRKQFSLLSPLDAKRLGSQIALRPNWDTVTRLECMELCLRSKFQNNPQLLDYLVATNDADLIEGNHWGDTFWGICKGKGSNYLGKLLMVIRGEHL